MAIERHILKELTAVPREDVEADLTAAQAEESIEAQIATLSADLERIKAEEGLLSQLLIFHATAELKFPGTTTVRLTAGPVPAAPKRGDISANALNIVQQAGGRPVSPAEVRKRLLELGIQADSNAIRVALRRWSQRGDIVKEGFVYRGNTSEETLIPRDRQELTPGSGVQTSSDPRVHTSFPLTGGGSSLGRRVRTSVLVSEHP